MLYRVIVLQCCGFMRTVCVCEADESEVYRHVTSSSQADTTTTSNSNSDLLRGYSLHWVICACNTWQLLKLNSNLITSFAKNKSSEKIQTTQSCKLGMFAYLLEL